MIRIISTSILLVGELILLSLAWRAWIATIRAELPSWRNAICLVALFLLSLNWCAAAVLTTLVFTDNKAISLTGVMLTLSRPLDVVAIAFAIALKGNPRIAAVLAGVLMFPGWPLGYV